MLEILPAFAFASRHDVFATKCDDVTNERYLHNDAVLINNLLDFAGISTSIHSYTVFHSSKNILFSFTVMERARKESKVPFSPTSKKYLS